MHARFPGLKIQRGCGIFICFETVAPVAQVCFQFATLLRLALNLYFLSSTYSILRLPMYLTMHTFMWCWGSTEPKALCKIGKHSANYATSLVSWILIMQSLNRTYTYCISVGYISEHSVALSLQSLCYSRHTMNDKHNTLWKMLKVNVRKANRKSRTEWGWEDQVQLHC